MSLRIGVIGCGSISMYHLNAYKRLKDVEVVAVCDLKRERVQEKARLFEVPAVFTSYDDMLNEKLDAVSVCTSNDAHAPAVIAALKAGVNVLCEKPPAMNAKLATEMLETSHAAKKLLMIGFSKRFSAKASVVKLYAERGYFGDFYSARTATLRRCGNPGGWFADVKRSGGGPIVDLGVHAIDMVRYIMGRPQPATVSAATFSKIGLRGNIADFPRWYSLDFDPAAKSTVEDHGMAFIRFANGAALSVEMSYSLHIDAVEMNILEVYGTKAGAMILPDLKFLSEDSNYLTTHIPWVPPDETFQVPFDKEIAHFVACVRGEEECKCPAEDGVAIMRILDAVYESARQGKEVSL